VPVDAQRTDRRPKVDGYTSDGNGLAITLDHSPLNSKTFSEMATLMLNICAKFRWNPSSNWREIVSRAK